MDEDTRLTTHNRFLQIHWLHEQARDIAWSADSGLEAEALVDYALSPDHAEPIKLPEWFDDNDRRLLTGMVERRIA